MYMPFDKGSASVRGIQNGIIGITNKQHCHKKPEMLVSSAACGSVVLNAVLPFSISEPQPSLGAAKGSDRPAQPRAELQPIQSAGLF